MRYFITSVQRNIKMYFWKHVIRIPVGKSTVSIKIKHEWRLCIGQCGSIDSTFTHLLFSRKKLHFLKIQMSPLIRFIWKQTTPKKLLRFLAYIIFIPKIAQKYKKRNFYFCDIVLITPFRWSHGHVSVFVPFSACGNRTNYYQAHRNQDLNSCIYEIYNLVFMDCRVCLFFHLCFTRHF